MLDETKAAVEHPVLGGIAMSIVVSIIRIIYDRKETSFMRIMLESILCGFLTLSAGSALVALGYSAEWYLFCGGAIGFMGSQTIRALANRLIDKRLP